MDGFFFFFFFWLTNINFNFGHVEFEARVIQSSLLENWVELGVQTSEKNPGYKMKIWI